MSDKTTDKLPDIATITKAKGYTVLAGFNFGCKSPDNEGTRVEPGPLTVALPADVLKSLIEQGVIVEVSE